MSSTEQTRDGSEREEERAHLGRFRKKSWKTKTVGRRRFWDMN